MIIYISGPMSGKPNKNIMAFNEAEKQLRKEGHTPINPTRSEYTCLGKTWSDYMRKDIVLLAGCESIFMLPGWEQSKGALFELYVARALGMTAFDYETRKLIDSGSILPEAMDATHRTRQGDYGHPGEDFERIAKLWSVIFSKSIIPYQVGLAMICVKLSREMNRHKKDNLVDIAGYAETVQMVHDYNEKFNIGVPQCLSKPSFARIAKKFRTARKSKTKNSNALKDMSFNQGLV